MPIHDWTRVESGLWHNFHQSWSVRIADALNDGRMGDTHYALIEQKVPAKEPDVIAVALGGGADPEANGGGTATLARPAAARRTGVTARFESDAATYARKANRVAIRHHLGRLVAVIELVSPGNKDGAKAYDKFVEKLVGFLRNGVHVMVVDLFPPTPQDPDGVYHSVAAHFGGEPVGRSADKPLTAVSFDASVATADIEHMAVGDPLPDLPLCLGYKTFVDVPLEATYAATWAVTPKPLRDLVQLPPGP